MAPIDVLANTWVTKDKCKGHRCEDPEFPLLDYSPLEKKCHCTAHPCHHDNNENKQRVVHSCSDPSLPFWASNTFKTGNCSASARSRLPPAACMSQESFVQATLVRTG